MEIADICEAAGRAELSRLPSLDRQTVKAFVNRLITNKFQNRQFADADMTLAELTVVCGVMEECLRAHYHERPAYGDVSAPLPEMSKTTSFAAEEEAARSSAPAAPVAAPAAPAAPAAVPAAPAAPAASASEERLQVSSSASATTAAASLGLVQPVQVVESRAESEASAADVPEAGASGGGESSATWQEEHEHGH